MEISLEIFDSCGYTWHKINLLSIICLVYGFFDKKANFWNFLVSSVQNIQYWYYRLITSISLLFV